MTIARIRTKGRQGGMALLVVLWGCTLAAITLGALASQARVEGLQAQGQTRHVETLYAAEAGIEQAVYRIQVQDPSQAWQTDGRPYEIQVGDAKVAVRIDDENGKINLNLASPELIDGLLRAGGAGDDDLPRLKKALSDWASDERLKAIAISGATGRGFANLDELYRVPGFSSELVERIEPALSLWSPQEPNLAHASALVVSAATGADKDSAEAFVARVRDMGPQETIYPAAPGTWAGEISRTASHVFTIEAKATIRGGAVLTLRVTMGLGTEPGNPLAYWLLRRQESMSSGEG